jgi:hypothetical protein
MERDKEFDAVMGSLSDPYIEKPDELDPSGALCWLDMQRMCGPDCVAFNTAATGTEDQCRALNAMTSQVVSLRQTAKTLADLKRGGIPQPPKV